MRYDACCLHLPVSTFPVRLATQCHCGERSHQQPVRFRAWDLREPLPGPSEHHRVRACQLVCGDFGARTSIKRAFGHCEWSPRHSPVWGSEWQTRQLDVEARGGVPQDFLADPTPWFLGPSPFQPSDSANTTKRGITSNGDSCSTHSPQKIEGEWHEDPNCQNKAPHVGLKLVEHVERTSSVAQNDVCGGFRCPSLGLWWQVPFPPLSADLVHPCTDRSLRPHCPTQCIFPALRAASVAFGLVGKTRSACFPLRSSSVSASVPFFTAKCLTACFQVLQKREQPLVRC